MAENKSRGKITGRKAPVVCSGILKNVFPVLCLLCMFIVSISSAGVITEESLYSENCYISPDFDLQVQIYPDITKSVGVLAKDQKFTTTIEGEPGSEVGVWLYRVNIGNPDKNVFVKFNTGSSGEIKDGVILDDARAYKLPSGRYYLYFVSGDSELTKTGFFPDLHDEFEVELLDEGSPYLRLEMYSEVPWIRCDQRTLPDIVTGEELKLSGTTNIAAGKDLIISIEPTAFDDPYFNDQIIERTGVHEADPYNTWEQSIDTSELGPGEYIVVVEGSDVDTESVQSFNVYDESYSATTPESGYLVVQTYTVDQDTKDLSEDQASDSGTAGTEKATDSSENMQQSPVGILSLVAMIAFVICITGYFRRRR